MPAYIQVDPRSNEASSALSYRLEHESPSCVNIAHLTNNSGHDECISSTGKGGDHSETLLVARIGYESLRSRRIDISRDKKNVLEEKCLIEYKRLAETQALATTIYTERRPCPICTEKLDLCLLNTDVVYYSWYSDEDWVQKKINSLIKEEKEFQNNMEILEEIEMEEREKKAFEEEESTRDFICTRCEISQSVRNVIDAESWEGSMCPVCYELYGPALHDASMDL
jgi:deoxycytidylate deaminase